MTDPADASRVLVSLRVDATPSRAFEVFTGEIDSWWRAGSVFRVTDRRPRSMELEPGPGGRLLAGRADGSSFAVGTTKVWEPPELLVLSWRHESFAEDQETEVRVHFEAVGDQTRVTVEHFGWDSIPEEHAARHGFPLGAFQQRVAEWWRGSLAAQRGLVDR